MALMQKIWASHGRAAEELSLSWQSCRIPEALMTEGRGPVALKADLQKN